MLVVTTPTVEGTPIKRYIGMVSGETFAGVNVFKDFGASLSNMFGGRASQYEEEIGNAAATAVNEMCARAQAMGANAVVGVKVDYFTAGSDNGMLAAIATGTAVILCVHRALEARPYTHPPGAWALMSEASWRVCVCACPRSGWRRLHVWDEPK